MTNKKDDKTVEMFPTLKDDIREDVKYNPDAHTQNLPMNAHGTANRKDSNHQLDSHAQKPSRADWQRLYQAADSFRDLAPWKWMDDDRIFGVKCPETGEIYYCCVLGALKEVFALVAYEGAEGLEGYLKLSSGEIENGPLASEYQRVLMASFESRSYLESRDLAVIRDLGRQYRGRNAWPLFRHYLPGYFPWFLSAVQTRTLAACLEQAVEILPRCARNPSLLANPDAGRYLVRVRETSADGKAEWRDTILAPTPLHRAAPNIPVNEIAIARLCRNPKKLSGDWEIGYCYTPMRIQEHPGQRPYLPRLLGIVDAQSGLILSMGVEADDKHLPVFRDMLLSCLEKAGQWPQCILVNHENAAALATPIAKALGISLKQVRNLPGFAMAYEHMLESMC